MKKPLTHVGRALLDFALPPRCQMCFEDVSEPHSVCGACWSNLTFIQEPCCAFCGVPFEYFVQDGAICASCLKDKPPFARLRAALLYDDASKPLLMRFKHGDGTYLAPVFAKWLLLAGRDLLKDGDLMVPVPLHWTRLLSRRYNQAALLTRELSFLTSLPWDPDVLKRIKRTASQGHLTKVQRFENVAAAFRVPEKKVPSIKGTRIVLVDDVFTTGATLKACATTLLKAGATRVDALTLSRVRGH